MSKQPISILEELDPFFLAVLPKLEAVYKNDGTGEIPENLRTTIMAAFHEIDGTLQHRQSWPEAKYALAAWLDEVLTRAPWGQERQEWCRLHSFEREFFHNTVASAAFYEKAHDVQQQRNFEVLEIFHLTAALGFRGQFRETSGLMKWANEIRAAIPKRPEQSLPEPIAPELHPAAQVGKIDIIWPAVVTALLLILIAFLFGKFVQGFQSF